jgi:DNA-binding CsgD family transcriptional regulator
LTHYPVPDQVVIREQAMREFRALAEEARARGLGLCVRVVGPPGIGKSTFLQSLSRIKRGPQRWIAGGRDAGVTLSGLQDLVHARTSRGTIFVDDLHALDEVTTKTLQRLLAQDERRVDVICSDRRDEAPSLGRHATIRLTPMRPAEAGAFVRSVLPAADEHLVAEIVRSSGGVPFALSFIAAQTRLPAAAEAGASSSVEGALSKRLDRSTEAARDLIRVCSVVDESVPVAAAATALGRPTAAVLDAAAEVTDLLVVDDMRLDFRHMLIRDAVRHALLDPLLAFRRLLDAYGSEDDDVRNLRSQLTCAVACADGTRAVKIATKAARVTVQHGALKTAASFLETALRHAPRPIPTDLAAEYAEVLQRSLRYSDAVEFLRELLQHALDHRDADRAVTLLASFCSAALSLERFIELDALSGRVERIADDPRLVERVRTIQMSSAAFEGRLDKFDDLKSGSALQWQDGRAAAFVSSLSGDAQAARQYMEHYQAHLEPRHAQLAIADRAMNAVIGLFLEGNDALADAGDMESANDDRDGYPTATALGILHRFNAGRWDEAADIIDALGSWDLPAEEPLPIIDVRLMFFGMTGRPMRHRERTLETIRTMIRRGQHRHAMGPAAWYCAMDMGEPPADLAGFVRHMIGEPAIPYLVASFPLAIARAATRVGGKLSGDALQANSPYGSPWHRAHIDLAKGRLDADHAALRRARDAFDALGCSALSMVAGVQLPIPRAADVALARTLRFDDSASSEPAPGVLTARERDVSELAASGASNREIAARLRIAERTVEVHLSSVYRKLGVRSRGALAARLLRRGETGTAGL